MRSIPFHFPRIWLSLSFARLVAPGFVLRFFLCIVSIFLASGFIFVSLVNANTSLNYQTDSEKIVPPLVKNTKSKSSIRKEKHKISGTSTNTPSKKRLNKLTKLKSKTIITLPSGDTPGTSSSTRKFQPSHATPTDYSSTGQYFTICCVTRELLSDDDGDGYYHRFSIYFDPDVDSGSAVVYANLYMYDSNYNNYSFLASTDDFSITETYGSDAQTFEFDSGSGYSKDTYDVFIELYTLVNGTYEYVANVGPDNYGDLNDLPIESADYDVYCTDDYEYNDDSNNAYGPLTSGDSLTGKICYYYDYDYFKITVASPGTIALALSGPSDKDYVLYSMILLSIKLQTLLPVRAQR